MQSDISGQGEHLVNFVSTIFSSKLMNLFLEKGLLEKRTFEEIMDTLKHSPRFRNEGGECMFRAQTDKERGGSKALGLMPALRRREVREDLARTFDDLR